MHALNGLSGGRLFVGGRNRTITLYVWRFVIHHLGVQTILDIHIRRRRLRVIITIYCMQVRLIYLLLYLIMFIQMTAIVLPTKVVKIIKSIIHR